LHNSTKENMRKSIISLLLLLVCFSIQAQSNLAGRIYYNANIKGNKIILDDGKELDTMYLSDDGNILTSKMDKDTPSNLHEQSKIVKGTLPSPPAS